MVLVSPIPPLKVGCGGYKHPTWIKKSSNFLHPNAFVMMSASCNFVGTCFVTIKPRMIITYEVNVPTDMFHTSTVDWISSEINCRQTVWMQSYWSRAVYTECWKEFADPNQFTNCVCHCTLFGFSRWSWDSILFHPFPLTMGSHLTG